MSSEVTPEELIIRRVRERVAGLHPNVFPNVWGDRRIAAGVFDRIRVEGFGALEAAEGLSGVRRPSEGTPKCEEWVCHWGGRWFSFDGGDSGVRALAKTWSRLALCGVLGDRPELLDNVIFPLPEDAEGRASLPEGSDDKSLPANAVVPAETDETSSPESGSAKADEGCGTAVPGPAEECSSAANAKETPAGSLTSAEVSRQSVGRSVAGGGWEGGDSGSRCRVSFRQGWGRRKNAVRSLLRPPRFLRAPKEVQSGGEPGVGSSSGGSGKGEE